MPRRKESHAFLGKFAASHSVSEGQRIMISCCCAPYSLAVPKHGFSFERKDASSFLQDITRLSVAQFSPGMLHKDICVSFGALCQACRLPKLSAHLPHAGQSPSFCQARATGTWVGNKDSHCSCPKQRAHCLGMSLRPPHVLWLSGSRALRIYVQGSGVRKAITGSFVRHTKDNVWSDRCVTRADEECLLCWEGGGEFCGLGGGAFLTVPEKALVSPTWLA